MEIVYRLYSLFYMLLGITINVTNQGLLQCLAGSLCLIFAGVFLAMAQKLTSRTIPITDTTGNLVDISGCTIRVGRPEHGEIIIEPDPAKRPVNGEDWHC